MKAELIKKLEERLVTICGDKKIENMEFLSRASELFQIRSMINEEYKSMDESFEEKWKAYCGKNEDLVKAKDAARFFYEVGKAQL